MAIVMVNKQAWFNERVRRQVPGGCVGLKIFHIFDLGSVIFPQRGEDQPSYPDEIQPVLIDLPGQFGVIFGLDPIEDRRRIVQDPMIEGCIG